MIESSHSLLNIWHDFSTPIHAGIAPMSAFVVLEMLCKCISLIWVSVHCLVIYLYLQTIGLFRSEGRWAITLASNVRMLFVHH